MSVSDRRRAAPLGIGLLGCGVRGYSNARAVQRGRRTFVARVADTNPHLAQDVGNELGVPWSTRYEDLLEDPTVEAVFISTPHHLHTGQAIRALEAGRHAIVEKPLATTVDDAERMVAAADRCDRVLAPWFGARYTPQLLRAKELMEAGAVGEVLGALVVFQNQKPSSYWRTGAGTDNWRAARATSGGGVLIMNGIHYLDLLLHLTDLDVREVCARQATLRSPAEVEDTLSMWMELENGALATATFSSFVQGSGVEGIVELRVWGTDGHLSLTPPAQIFVTRRHGDLVPERWNGLDATRPQSSSDIEAGANARFLDGVVGAIRREHPLPIPTSDGVKLQRLIDAAYRSATDGHPVTLTSRAVA